MSRIMLEVPNWDGHYEGKDEEMRWVRHRSIGWHRPSWGHGGDEYGNCSLYFRTPLFGIVWFYPTGHYQTDVETPEPGENQWADRVLYEELWVGGKPPCPACGRPQDKCPDMECLRKG